MNRSTLAFLVLLLCGAAQAQSPDEDWKDIPSSAPPVVPGDPSLPPPPPPPPPSYEPPRGVPPPMPGSTGLLKPRPEVVARIRPPEDRNRVSMLAAPTLGAGKRGQMVLLGFPMLSIRALFGLSERFDLGVGFDTYYFLMNEPRVVLRVGLAGNENWSFAGSLEAGYAFFTQRASRESRSSRWLTGRRNINISPGLVVAYQGNRPRDGRLFLEARYTLALDTEPYATDPLVGVPPAVVPGHNVSIKGGAELPLSSKTAFVFSFGFDVHGREVDAVVMPTASLGLITSL